MINFSFKLWLEAEHQDNAAIRDFVIRAGNIANNLLKNRNNPEVIKNSIAYFSKMLYSSITSSPDFDQAFKYSPISRLAPLWNKLLESIKSQVTQAGGNAFSKDGWVNFYCGKDMRVLSKMNVDNNKVVAKSYFKPDIGNLDNNYREVQNRIQTLTQALTRIWNACCHISKKSGISVALKIPQDLSNLINHRRSLVVYYGDDSIRQPVEQVVNTLIKTSGLKSGVDHGFDIGNDSFDSIRAKQVAHDLVNYIIQNGRMPPKTIFWIREKLQQRGLGSPRDMVSRMQKIGRV
jgi:hypothetical protein